MERKDPAAVRHECAAPTGPATVPEPAMAPGPTVHKGPHLMKIAACGLLLAAGSAQAQVTSPTITSRMSSVVGSFIVGYSTLGDGGSFSETLHTLDAAYSQDQFDAGGVEGVAGGLPVLGTASFAVTQDYGLTPLLISLSGSGASAAATPYGYVSIGARTISHVRLSFTVAEPIAYELSGQVTHAIGEPVQGLAPTASALAQFTGGPGGGVWLSTITPGAFSTSGTLLPGRTYQLEGRANSNLNANSQFIMNLALSPVPEPASSALLCAGMGMLLWRRRTATRQALA